ncbi:hypothetical protein [Candidatus Stoquefichus sp. SB1]|uniref:hypothetical protein n=1 Tax=Candidatus Stoquefichus sp. SB1 TaxID=1658109 RepID=UPI0012FF5183|nr:hypothetical protein [Candidatus Stoquefichus sp. SB1]
MKAIIEYKNNQQAEIDEIEDVAFCKYDIEIYYPETDDVTVICKGDINSIEISEF